MSLSFDLVIICICISSLVSSSNLSFLSHCSTEKGKLSILSRNGMLKAIHSVIMKYDYYDIYFIK